MNEELARRDSLIKEKIVPKNAKYFCFGELSCVLKLMIKERKIKPNAKILTSWEEFDLALQAIEELDPEHSVKEVLPFIYQIENWGDSIVNQTISNKESKYYKQEGFSYELDILEDGNVVLKNKTFPIF